VTDEAALARWVALAREAGVVAVDTETDSLDARRANMVGFSLAIAPGRACYVPIRHGSTGDMLAAPAPEQIAPDVAFALLRPLFTDAAGAQDLFSTRNMIWKCWRGPRMAALLK
jgi:DNA polymerase-1